jgi:nucleoside-diphosphate-sugar epimerase
MKVLLLGGTGAMGGHLKYLFLKRGAEVFVTSRKPLENEFGITNIQGDAKEENFIRRLFQQRWDVIVDFMIYSTTQFRDRVELLLSATRLYIYLSSARVYAKENGRISEGSPRLLDVTDDHRFLQTDEYALAKARQEDILFKSGLENWTIVRPYITYDNYRLQLGVMEKEGWLYRALQGRNIVMPKDLNERQTTLTSGFDVAKAICAIAMEPKACGEIFQIATNQTISWGEVLDIYLTTLESHIGSKPHVLEVDSSTFLRFHSGKYQYVYDRLFDRSFDTRKLSSILEIESFIEPREGLRCCLNAFLKLPTFLDIDWRSEAIKDKITSQRSGFREMSGSKSRLRYITHRYLK